MSPLRILIVDDEPAILDVVEQFLETTGLAIVKAPNGWEALRAFDDEKCDLVISDRVMPGLSGVEFARAIKKRSPDTPVILISGLLTAGIDATPFDGFLPKPFSRNQLRSVVAGLLPDDPPSWKW